MDSKGKERGILKLEPRPRVVIDTPKAELTPQGSYDFPPSSPQPSVDRLSVTWAEPGSMSSSGVNLFHLPSETPVSNEVKFSPSAGDGSEDEDYSASLSAVLRQRRASVRRSRKGRTRRPSSPFLGDEGRPRRRSSVFTTSSGDTAISMEEPAAVVTQEQIFENIHLHKEVLGSVKQQPLGMRRKLKIVHQAKGYIKRHEGQLQERLAQSKSTRDIYARFNILLNTKWQQIKREALNTSNLLIPWELRIKEIESHFGSVVASYFTFLRWLFWVNLVIGFILLVFVIVPECLTADPNDDGERKIIMEEERQNASNLLTLWEFEGVLKFSPIFYGYYSNIERVQYRMPLAYFLTGLAVYIYSFVAILRKMAENSRMSKLSEKEDECIFSWKLFTGWDFMIGNTETAHNRIASVILGFKEALLEEAEKKKDLRNWRIISLRAIVNIFVVVLLIVSAYAVVTVVSRSDNNQSKFRNWFSENLTTIVVTLISITFPVFFELLGLLEHYHPRKQLRLQLARIMLLNLLNLYSLIFALFSKIEGMSRDLDSLKPVLILNATMMPNGTLNINENMALKTPDSCYEEEVSCEICNTELMVPIILNNGITINTTAATPFSIVCTSFKMNLTPKRLRRQRDDSFNYTFPNDKEKNNSALTTNIQLGLEQLKIINQLIKLQPKNISYETDVNDPDDDEYSFYDTETTSDSTDKDKDIKSYNYPSTTMDSAPKTANTANTYGTETELFTSEYIDTTFSFNDNTDYTTGMMSYSDTKYISSTSPYEVTTYKGDSITESQSEKVKTEITTMDLIDQSTAYDISDKTSYSEIPDMDYETTDMTFSSEMTDKTMDFETTDRTHDFSYATSNSAIINSEMTTDKTTDLGTTDEMFNSARTDKTTDSDTTVKASTFEASDKTTVADTTDVTINSKVSDKTTDSDITITSIYIPKDYTTETSIIFTASNVTTIERKFSTDRGLKSTPTVPTTTKSILPTVISPKSCSNMSCNCTVNCSGEVITQVFSMSNCTAVNKVCYKRICGQGAEEKVNGKNLVADIAYVDEQKIKRYNLTNPTKKKLLKLCWETMFGQELIKLTMMDLVFVLLGTLFMDFFRALLVRYLNRCWCWDLEKKFPEYGDFKIAENILHLINNQGMVWMGMFFSPGLVVLNVVKLMIMMYLRSWAVMTCNVPHEVVFRVSKSNNFYLALLLTMLFLCVLPVGYSIVWVKPSWHCGPFSEYDKIYCILINYINKLLPSSLNFALEYIASPAIVIPLLVLLILIIYYLTSLTNSLREANNDLKIQLRRERTEERRKMFQLADTRRRGGSSAMENTPFARWKKALPSFPMSKSIDSDDRKTLTEEINEPVKIIKKRGGIFAKIVGMALDKKPDVDVVPEVEIPTSLPNNADDETDTDFHETLPKEVLRIKDIAIVKPEPKKRNSVEFKTDDSKTRKSIEKSLKVKLEKVEDRTEKKAIIEKQIQDARNAGKPKIIDELPKEKVKSKKIQEKQVSESSTQSRQSDSTVIPVITISTTESDEEVLAKTEKKSKNGEKDKTKHKTESKPRRTPDLKSLRRQSSVESINEHKLPTQETKKEEGHKYQYSL